MAGGIERERETKGWIECERERENHYLCVFTLFSCHKPYLLLLSHEYCAALAVFFLITEMMSCCSVYINAGFLN